MKLKLNEQEYWENYLATLNIDNRPINARVTAAFAGNSQITDELLSLYLQGKKTAGSSLVKDFLTAGDPLPQVGDHWIYLDSCSEPRCILRTDRIVTYKFRDIPLEIPVAEGEGDLSIEYWKRVHSELYKPYLNQWGISDLSEATVITEFFSLVYG